MQNTEWALSTLPQALCWKGTLSRPAVLRSSHFRLDQNDTGITCVPRSVSTSQTFLKVQRQGQDHYLMEFTGAPSTKTVLSPAIGGPPEQIACAQVCGSLRASMQKALPVVELETWAPVGCAQQGLDSTGQIHEHVAHEEEPGAESLVRRLPHQAVLWYPGTAPLHTDCHLPGRPSLFSHWCLLYGPPHSS